MEYSICQLMLSMINRAEMRLVADYGDIDNEYRRTLQDARECVSRLMRYY